MWRGFFDDRAWKPFALEQGGLCTHPLSIESMSCCSFSARLSVHQWICWTFCRHQMQCVKSTATHQCQRRTPNSSTSKRIRVQSYFCYRTLQVYLVFQLPWADQLLLVLHCGWWTLGLSGQLESVCRLLVLLFRCASGIGSQSSQLDI